MVKADGLFKASTLLRVRVATGQCEFDADGRVLVESGIPPSSEISKMKRSPEDPSASLVYLDSYDEIRKVDSTYRDLLEGKESERDPGCGLDAATAHELEGHLGRGGGNHRCVTQ